MKLFLKLNRTNLVNSFEELTRFVRSNRSVKNLNLAAWCVIQNLPVLQCCEIEVFNGSSFLRFFNKKLWVEKQLYLLVNHFLWI
jgi:hypothetical protein